MFVSDCKTGGGPYSLWTNPVTAYGFTGATGNDPCDRHDKVWVPSAPAASSIWYVYGYTAGLTVTCTFGSGFVATDLQEVEYNVDGGAWTPVDNYLTPVGLPVLNTSFLRAQDVGRTAALPAGTNHVVGLRYRNWKYIGSTAWNIPFIGPGGDCRSPVNTSLPLGQQDYSTWAYQYFIY